MTMTNPAIEIAALDAVAQADLVRRGEVTCTELVQWGPSNGSNCSTPR